MYLLIINVSQRLEKKGYAKKMISRDRLTEAIYKRSLYLYPCRLYLLSRRRASIFLGYWIYRALESSTNCWYSEESISDKESEQRTVGGKTPSQVLMMAPFTSSSD